MGIEQANNWRARRTNSIKLRTTDRTRHEVTLVQGEGEVDPAAVAEMLQRREAAKQDVLAKQARVDAARAREARAARADLEHLERREARQQPRSKQQRKQRKPKRAEPKRIEGEALDDAILKLRAKFDR
jgi:uncharacterized protein YaiL (DUF2058 family)